jgi:hypothetical protein
MITLLLIITALICAFIFHRVEDGVAALAMVIFVAIISACVHYIILT